MFDKLADIIIKHPKPIIVIWIAVLLISVGVIITTDSNVKYDMTSMEGGGSESVDGMEIITEHFYQEEMSSMGTIIVVKYGSSADENSFFNELSRKVSERYGAHAMVVRAYDVASEGIAMYSMVYDSTIKGGDQVENLRDIISDAKTSSGIGVSTYVTGSDAINHDTEAGAMKDMMLIDPIAILLILVLIGLFFRSFAAAATPPLAVGAAYGIMMCLIFFLGGFMDIFYITPILMLVSMLGAGCDYCIFIIARYREERKGGKDKEGALRESVRWAGESITTSGLSVIIGFGVMSFCSFSMVSTMGIVLALGIVVALLAALTFIPSVLMIVGDRIFYPSKIETYQKGSKAMEGWYGNWSRRGKRYFSSSAKHAIKYSVPIVLGAVLITVPLTYVTLTEETSYDMIGTMPPGEARDGVDIIVSTVGGGVIMPTYYVAGSQNSLIDSIDHQNRELIWNDAAFGPFSSDMRTADDRITGLDNVQYAMSLPLYRDMEILIPLILSNMPADVVIGAIIAAKGIDREMATAVYGLLQGYVETASAVGMDLSVPAQYNYLAYLLGFVSEDGMYTKTTVIMKDEPMSAISMDTIDDIRKILSEISAASSALSATWVTGSVAITYDISNTVNSEFRWIELGVVVLIFLLLFFVLKSYLTPLRAIITILMSIMWTLGLTHILFSWVLDVPVLWIIPIVLLVVCLGLGMDYDILLTTRIRENRLKGMSNDEAIANAVEKSGAVITLCGLIMSGTFATLMLSSSPMLQEFGFALSFAILVDALVVRTYIVPAIMHLMGDWNWKGPKWLQRGKHKIEFEENSE